MIALVQQSAGTDSEILYPISLSQHTAQHSRITVTITILDTCSIRNTISNASYTDSIFMRYFETTEPRRQFVQHFILIEETLANSPSMSAGRVNMKYRRNIVLVQRQIIINSVSRRNDFIIITIYDKSTRCIFRHLLFIRIFKFQFSRSIFSQKVVVRAPMGIRFIHRNHRIKKNLKVRTKFGLSMSGNGRSQMSTGRRAHDTNVIRVQIPDIGTVTHQFHCCFSIRNG